MKSIILKFFDTLTGKRKYIFFAVLALICVVALSIGIYAQFFYQYSDTDALMLGINISGKKSTREIDSLKANFNNLFTNSIITNSYTKIDKPQPDKELVYLGYSLVNEDENYYSVNAQIPYLNIDSQVAQKINTEIRSEFYDKANSIMRKNKGNTIYNVSYAAFVNNDIVSIVIKSSLKEENKAEKVIIKTYNYNMKEEKNVTLNELIKEKKLTTEEVQNLINKDIKIAYNNAKNIANQYGSLYERNLSSDIYSVKSSTTFFLTQDGYVYIIYAYGNKDYTNEMDIIIF